MINEYDTCSDISKLSDTYAVSSIPTEEKDIAPIAQAESGRR